MPYKKTKVGQFREENEKDVKLVEYLEKMNLKTGTEYLKWMVYKKYMKYNNKTMTELLREARDDQDTIKYMDERRICKRMTSFLQYLQDSKLDNSTIRSQMIHVKAFYNHYEIKQPKIKLPKIIRKQRRLLTIEEARKGLDTCKIRYRALFHLQMTSGMDVSTACSMNYSHFINSISDEINIKNPFDIVEIAEKVKANKDIIGTWIYERVKTSDGEGGDEVYTFCTHECLLTIIEYLEWRQRIGLYPESLDEPLFIIGEAGSTERINPSTACKYSEKKNDGLGFGKIKNKRVFVTHNFRKMFSNALYINKVDKLKIDWMLGHAVNDVDFAYFSAPEHLSNLKEEYRECSKSLIFNPPEYIDKTSEKVIELEEKIKGLMARLEKAKEQGFKNNMDIQYIRDMIRSEMMEEIKSNRNNELLRFIQKEKGEI